MRTALAPVVVISVLLALTGCEPATVAPDGGTVSDTGETTIDVGRPDAAGAHDTGPRRDAAFPDSGPATPFEAPNETWTFVPVPGAECGNGSELGVGVNLTDRSHDVVLFFQGGGACWDALTCFTVGSASHITDTLTESTVLGEARDGTSFIFERSGSNPFADASYVYLPYCTGDAHAGANVATYGDREVHHVGSHNTQLVLDRMAATFPDAERIWLVGVSAGGYGVVANWWRAQDAFPSARVDALADCGDTLFVPLGRWRTMLDSWGFEFPPSCTDCDSLDDALPYYAETMPPPHRYGLLAYMHDPVISTFFTLSTDNIAAGLLILREGTAVTPNQRTFFVEDNAHVLLGEPDRAPASGGPTVREWVTQFATDDAAWADQGP
jgi:hypothetical protein